MNHVVLLGDSIFDNASYVRSEELSVIDQLCQRLAPSWQATLLAVDGDVLRDVLHQTDRLPADTSHLVVSCGGNDALGYRSVLAESAHSVGDALQRLAQLQDSFRLNYKRMIDHLLAFHKPMAVCTIYTAIPGLEPAALTALSLFNDVILEEAFAAGVAVIDLRLICVADQHYSEISPIEPSALGGERIVQVIDRFVREGDDRRQGSHIYT
jgi:hypothetical protein